MTDIYDIMREYMHWLQDMVDDKDMQPIQNDTYFQCLDKLLGMVGEDMKKENKK